MDTKNRLLDLLKSCTISVLKFFIPIFFWESPFFLILLTNKLKKDYDDIVQKKSVLKNLQNEIALNNRLFLKAVATKNLKSGVDFSKIYEEFVNVDVSDKPLGKFHAYNFLWDNLEGDLEKYNSFKKLSLEDVDMLPNFSAVKKNIEVSGKILVKNGLEQFSLPAVSKEFFVFLVRRAEMIEKIRAKQLSEFVVDIKNEVNGNFLIGAVSGILSRVIQAYTNEEIAKITPEINSLYKFAMETKDDYNNNNETTFIEKIEDSGFIKKLDYKNFYKLDNDNAPLDNDNFMPRWQGYINYLEQQKELLEKHLHDNGVFITSTNVLSKNIFYKMASSFTILATIAWSLNAYQSLYKAFADFLSDEKNNQAIIEAKLAGFLPFVPISTQKLLMHKLFIAKNVSSEEIIKLLGIMEKLTEEQKRFEIDLKRAHVNVKKKLKTYDPYLIDLIFNDFAAFYENKNMFVDLVPSYGMFLIGAPGTGKTSLIKRIQEALDFDIIKLTVNEEFLKNVEGSEQGQNVLVEKILESRANGRPLLVFIDEADRIVNQIEGFTGVFLRLLDRNGQGIYDKYTRSFIPLGNVFFVFAGNMTFKNTALMKRLNVRFFPDLDWEKRYDLAINYVLPEYVAKYGSKTIHGSNFIISLEDITEIDKQMLKDYVRKSVGKEKGMRGIIAKISFLIYKKLMEKVINNIKGNK